ncbi:hypothetical protein SAV31267_096530 [Streptomyces avermitilis]|uniref:Secreted protein n=1 Tax=Streptomyces avermitilis TaxID=33903 RepID=A0A4D4N6G3_STRAX|nr:hypothetical protein SAV31267_096530 [Streptomyces avermitilis]
MAVRRARLVSVGFAGAVLAGLLSTVSVVSPIQAAAASDDPTPVVPSQSLGSVPAQQTEEVGKALPAPKWPSAAEATVDLSEAAAGEPGTVSPEPSASASGGVGDGESTQVGEVVEVAPVAEDLGTEAQLSLSRLADESTPSPSPSVSDGSEPSTPPTAEASPSPEPSESASDEPIQDPVSPDQVEVRVLDREAVAPAGGIGLGLQVSRTDGVDAPGQVQVDIDYSGFKYAYGADFASRLRLVKVPACALQTPDAESCADREFVPVDNDTDSGTLTATVTAAADTGSAGASAQLMREAGSSSASVYAVTSSSSSDAGITGRRHCRRRVRGGVHRVGLVQLQRADPGAGAADGLGAVAGDVVRLAVGGRPYLCFQQSGVLVRYGLGSERRLHRAPLPQLHRGRPAHDR